MNVHFKRSAYQLAILREHMKQIYLKEYGLALHTVQRWGSQFSVPSTLLRAERALRAWANDARVQ